jgi:hypothetical protein
MVELLERLDEGGETRVRESREFLDAGAIPAQQLPVGRLHVFGPYAREGRQSLVGEQWILH